MTLVTSFELPGKRAVIASPKLNWRTLAASVGTFGCVIVSPKSDGENPTTNELVPAEGRAVWYGAQVDYRAEGMHVLSPGEIYEIDAGLAHLRSLGSLDFPDMTPETFPLPTLGEFFGGLGRELLHGRGFLLLRRLPRERYSLDDLGLIYYGLGVHLGRPVAQSYQGELLGNVIDVSDVEAQARGYHGCRCRPGRPCRQNRECRAPPTTRCGCASVLR